MSDNIRTWLGACLIVLVGAATYANSLSGRMLLDDQSAIVLNPQIRHLWPLTESLAAPRNNELESRPLVNLSFAINYAIGELSVRGYHLVNVSLHIASALLLFGIIRMTLASGKLRDRFAADADGVAGQRADLDGPSAADRAGRLPHAAHRAVDGAVLPADAVWRDSRRSRGRAGAMAGGGDHRVPARDGVQGVDGDGARDGDVVRPHLPV
jgi:hypothetical protein